MLLSVSVVFAVLLLAVSSATDLAQHTFDEIEEGLALLSFERYSSAIQQFELDAGVYPVSLDALAATPGYEELIDMRRNEIEYFATGGLSDGAYLFNRAVIFRQDSRFELNAADYLNGANNSCGPGPAGADESWCGRPDSLWDSFESRKSVIRRLGSTREWMIRTLYRFVDGFNQTGEFPRDWPGGTMAAGEVRPLADLAGYGSGNSPTGCNGIYVFENVPLTCEDFFSPISQGTVLYEFVSDDEIAVSVGSGILRDDGTEILVALTIEPEV